MKYEIFGQEDEIEDIVTLRFINNKRGVTVATVDEHGCATNHLLTFTPNGFVKMLPAVSMELGFHLDHCGRIQVV